MTAASAEEARKKQLRAEYVARVNRVIDHVQANIDRDLSLAELARVANFSPFHFHRVFAAMVGETLAQFVARIRLERAAAQLLANPARSVTEVALDAGYSSSAAFARAFREAFGTSASTWRRNPARRTAAEDRKIGQSESSLGNAGALVTFHIDPRTCEWSWRVEMSDSGKSVDVVVKELAEMPVAYVRHIGPYAGQGELFARLFGSLMQWAGPRGLIRFPETRMLSVYYDDPAVTDESRLRVDCCITVPADTPAEGEVGRSVVPGGKYAVARFELGEGEYSAAWEAVMGGWLPESGLQCDDRPCFELYLNDPKQHPEGKQLVEICVPVRPM